jgi:hypothetical protein
MTFSKLLNWLMVVALFVPGAIRGQVPNLISYQGRVVVGPANFNGTGGFKFALVSGDGSTTYWSNDGTSIGGSAPGAAVAISVSKGLYAVLLGDTSLANMTAIPSSVFANPDMRLRVWFDDGTHGSQLLTPDQRLAPTSYVGSDVARLSAASNTFTGTIVAGAFSGAGVLPWQTVTTTAVQGIPNQGYIASNAAEVLVTLPTSANVGDIVRVTGAGAGGWRIGQNAGQTIAGSSLTASTTNAGWSQRANLLLNCIASSFDGSRLVGAYGSAVYTSSDSGVSWAQRYSASGSGSSGHNAVASSADGRKLVFVAVNGFVSTSVDYGATWTTHDSPRNWYAVASSADGSKLVAAVFGGQIYTSTDSGLTWTARDSARGWDAVASSADGNKMVAIVSGGQIYTSTDSGATWTARDSSRNWYCVASSADGSKLVAGLNTGQVYTSADSGATWTAHDSSRSWVAVASSSDGARLVAASNSGLLQSADAGATWALTYNLNSANAVASSGDGTKLVADAYNGSQCVFTSSFQPSFFTTTSGAGGSISGSQYSAVELQYIGNGQWMQISSAGTIFAN